MSNQILDTGSVNGVGYMVNFDNVKWLQGLGNSEEDVNQRGVMIHFIDGTSEHFPGITIEDVAKRLF